VADSQGVIQGRHGEPTVSPRRTFPVRPTAAVIAALVVLVAVPSAWAGPVHVIDRVKADVGEGLTLFSNDDFKVTGKCEDSGSGDFTANTFLAAKRKHLVYFKYSGFDFDADFGPSDGKVEATGNAATGTDPAFEAAEYYDFWAEGRNRIPLNGRLATGVHLKGADCIFSGTIVGGERGGPVHPEKRIKAVAGEAVTIYSNKDFKVTGECEDNGGGDLTANTFIAAKRKNLVLYLTEADPLTDVDFDPGDGKVDLFPDFYDADGTDSDYVAASYSNDFYAEGQGGAVLQGRIGTGVHVQGADCTFSGLFVRHQSPGGGMHVIDRIRVDKGDATTIFQNQDFKITGKCRENAPGDFTADAVVAAKRKNLLYYAYAGDPFYDLDFDPGDGNADLTTDDATGTDPAFYAEDDYDDFYGEGPGGRVLAGRVAEGVHIRDADCTFSGIFIGS
jgi:hypothetical protein